MAITFIEPLTLVLLRIRRIACRQQATPRHLAPILLLILLMSLLLPGVAFADAPPPPDGWIRTSPTMDEETKRCRVVHLEPPWEVRSVNGRLSISPHDHESDLVIPKELEDRIKQLDWGMTALAPHREMQITGAPPQAIATVAGGWLVGFDEGEWGGGLWWVPRAGAPELIYEKNTRYLFWWGGKLYAAGGLNHMMFWYSFILELNNENGNWTIGDVIQLDDVIGAITVIDAERAFATIGSKPFIVHRTGEVVPQPKAGQYWRYARSIAALKDNRFAVGMDIAVAELELRDGELHETSLLMRKDCVRLRRIPDTEHFRCRCVPASK